MRMEPYKTPVFLLMESPYDDRAVDAIRDDVPSGFPEDCQWARVVFKGKRSVDPYSSREAAEKDLIRCKELGVDVQVVEKVLNEEGQIV